MVVVRGGWMCRYGVRDGVLLNSQTGHTTLHSQTSGGKVMLDITSDGDRMETRSTSEVQRSLLLQLLWLLVWLWLELLL